MPPSLALPMPPHPSGLNGTCRTSDTSRCGPHVSPGDFETMVNTYSARLLSVARRFLRCEEEAADAVQDALLSAFASLPRFQASSTFYTWLYRIMVNVCLMKLRARPNARTYSIHQLQPPSDEHRRQGNRLTAWSERADNRLEREETRAVVRDCINRLPEDYREVLLMRDIAQWDTDRTADALQLSRAAVKTRLHRARRALRSLLSQHDGFEDSLNP